jgi:hypothetical protein
MKYGTWAVAFIALAACGSIGWLIGRGDRSHPLVSIPDQIPNDRRAAKPVSSVSDEEARKRVLELIDLKVLGEAPVIKNPCTVDGLEYEAARSCVEAPASDDLSYEAGLLMMPYAEANAPTSLPVPSLIHRFDLWMLLFTCGPKLTGTIETAEPPMKLRSLRECEECPAHPEVDTLEFRPTDAKKGAYEEFQKRTY